MSTRGTDAVGNREAASGAEAPADVPSQSYERIFHPTDLSVGDEVAFVHALRMAWAARCRLSLMHVCHTPHNLSWDSFPHVRDFLVRWGELPEGATHGDVVRGGLDVQKIKTAGHDAARVVAAHLEEHPSDLVVLSTHQSHGFDRWLHKSVSEAVARSCPSPALFVPRHGQGFVGVSDGAIALSKVLVPVDHNPSCRHAIEELGKLSDVLKRSALEVHFLHVSSEDVRPPVPAVDHPGWDCVTSVRRGDVVEAIVRCALEMSADLIVMPTSGHHGFLDALRGSITERVVRNSPCPVLAVPTPLTEGRAHRPATAD